MPLQNQADRMGFCCASYEESTDKVLIELHLFSLKQSAPFLACLAIKIAITVRDASVRN